MGALHIHLHIWYICHCIFHMVWWKQLKDKRLQTAVLMWNCPTTILAEFWCIVDSKTWILEEIKWFGWVWAKIVWYTASQNTVKMVVCCTINVVPTETYVRMWLSRLSGLAMLLDVEMDPCFVKTGEARPDCEIEAHLAQGWTQALGSGLKPPPIPKQSLKNLRALWKSCKLIYFFYICPFSRYFLYRPPKFSFLVCPCPYSMG